MKYRLLLLTAIAAVSICFCSCEKTRTCVCYTERYTQREGIRTETTTSIDYVDIKGREECRDLNVYDEEYWSSSNGVSYSTNYKVTCK